uniref:ATP synthase complex subunit 8 n=1 Tax=Metrocoris ciliatus TaxID=3095934 RepID=A0AB38Z6B0_9HEMI|nr:ATP synthase F0 subunit 8 [Metrocoris ciliatus]WPW46921.1 ATP synthase F0 subunit 8 [Metrocoris ciliatus]
MPQMAPLSWLTLMIIFLMTMLMINTLMYFNKNYITKTGSKNNLKTSINWKW